MLFYRILFCFLLLGFLISCASEKKAKKDTSELYAKSQQVDEILKRSGTALGLGKNDKIDARALKDAENRLRTGGGLFGKEGPEINSLWGNKKNEVTASIGMPINAILWRSSLEVLDFMPLSSVDAVSGVIITDWYGGSDTPNERCKLNIFIKGKELKTNNLKVKSFCQQLRDGAWLTIDNSADKDRQIENAILNRAKKIKLSLN